MTLAESLRRNGELEAALVARQRTVVLVRPYRQC